MACCCSEDRGQEELAVSRSNSNILQSPFLEVGVPKSDLLVVQSSCLDSAGLNASNGIESQPVVSKSCSSVKQDESTTCDAPIPQSNSVLSLPGANETQAHKESHKESHQENEDASDDSGFTPEVDVTQDTQILAAMGISHLLGQFPRGMSYLKKTFRGLQSSVVEVIRIAGMELHMPTSTASVKFPNNDYYALVCVERHGPRCCRKGYHQDYQGPRCCRRCRNQTYDVFRIPLIPLSMNVWTASGGCFDVRVPRHFRLLGRLFITVTIHSSRENTRSFKLSDSEKSRRSSRNSLTSEKKIAKYVTRLPPFFIKDCANLEMQSAGKTPDGMAVWVQIKPISTSRVFDVGACRPNVHKLLGFNEWQPSFRHWPHVWASTWTQACLVKKHLMLWCMTSEMKNDAVIMYQTLFAQNSRPREGHPPLRPNLTEEEKREHDIRVLFLKRLLLCIAVCRLTYTVDTNGTTTQPWPFPLASAFGHGGRILVRLDGVGWKELLNFLLFGEEHAHDWDKHGVPQPLKARWAATHGVRLDPQTSQLYERRLQKRNSGANLMDGFVGHHLGMDLPLGGLGNPMPVSAKRGKLFAGPSGMPFESISCSGAERGVRYVKEMQHGHLYLRWDDFGVQTLPVLVPSSSTTKTEADTNSQPSFYSPSGSSMDHKSTSSEKMDMEEEGIWARKQPHLQLPTIRTRHDLEEILREHGCHKIARDEDGSLTRLFTQILRRELGLQVSAQGNLRVTGILIHLVFERIHDGEKQVLMHVATTAEAREIDAQETATTGSTNHPFTQANSTSSTAYRVEELRIPMLVRYRHESWRTAVSRFCQEHLQLSSQAAERIVDICQKAEAEMSTYVCEPAHSVCYRHGDYGDELEIQYDAYRFMCHLPKKDGHLFTPMLKERFQTLERDEDLLGFSGHPAALGTLTHEWAWVSESEASRLNAAGLHPPEDRLHIIRETGHLSALLIGIEGSAPLKENCFGGAHGPTGISKDISAFGKRKWRDYRHGGQEVPADTGGMHMTINEEGLQMLQDLCSSLNLFKPSDGYLQDPRMKAEKHLFRDLLQSSDETAGGLLAKNHELQRPSLEHSCNTYVFDTYVRKRQHRSRGRGGFQTAEPASSLVLDTSERTPAASNSDSTVISENEVQIIVDDQNLTVVEQPEFANEGGNHNAESSDVGATLVQI